MTLEEEVELIKFAGPYRNYPGTGGIWLGDNTNFSDGEFSDWALGRAMARIAQAVMDGELVIKETSQNE